MREPTPKQQCFVEEYLVDLNSPLIKWLFPALTPR